MFISDPDVTSRFRALVTVNATHKTSILKARRAEEINDVYNDSVKTTYGAIKPENKR